MLARRLAILDSLPPDLQTAEGSGLKKVGTSWKAKARRRQREGVLANLGNHGAWGPARPAGYLPPHPDFDGLVAAAGNGRDRWELREAPKDTWLATWYNLFKTAHRPQRGPSGFLARFFCAWGSGGGVGGAEGGPLRAECLLLTAC